MTEIKLDIEIEILENYKGGSVSELMYMFSLFDSEGLTSDPEREQRVRKALAENEILQAMAHHFRWEDANWYWNGKNW